MSVWNNRLQVISQESKHRIVIDFRHVRKHLGMNLTKMVVIKHLTQDIPSCSDTFLENGGFFGYIHSVTMLIRPSSMQSLACLDIQWNFGIRIDGLMRPNNPFPETLKRKAPYFSILLKSKILKCGDGLFRLTRNKVLVICDQ